MPAMYAVCCIEANEDFLEMSTYKHSYGGMKNFILLADYAPYGNLKSSPLTDLLKSQPTVIIGNCSSNIVLKITFP
jgi:hypothetical protein